MHIKQLILEGFKTYKERTEVPPFHALHNAILGKNGSGKCFARGTRLRLFNGDTIAVEDIAAAVLRGPVELMGDDGQPRTVTPGTLVHHIPAVVMSDSDDDDNQRAEGQEEEPLYRITPNWPGARPFTVNGAHILVLVNNAKPYKVQRNDGYSSGYWRVGWWELGTDNVMLHRSMCRASWTEADAQAEVDRRTRQWQPLEWEVSVDDFLATAYNARYVCMLVAAKAVTFHNPQLPRLSVVLARLLGVVPSGHQVKWMAWWLGCWLADGSSAAATVYQGGAPPPDLHHHREIFTRLLDYTRLFNEPVVQAYHNTSSAGWDVYAFNYVAGGVADRVLRAYGLIRNKHVPRALICDLLGVRRALLAGIIDGDGHYHPVSNDYELPAKKSDVCAGYKELAATLGLRNSDVHPHVVTNQQTGDQYDGHRVFLTGDMWDAVQYCAASYKRCPQPGTPAYVAKNKDSRCYGFKIRRLPEDEYFGFGVHGGANRRFLLEDYTVTHNSNLLDAIQFVLSDKYTSTSDREKLLYEGAGREIIAATVELIFDNSDTRFPLDQSEISIRRSIGTKKDEYFLNQKHIAKQEIVSLLESAGLSRSNPYYIVQQGKINQLIKMRDSERLELLKEIAGTRTYDERRRESIKIMKDTDSRLSAITDIIAYLEGRLEELEGEKTELKKYQSLDTRRRLLEWLVYDKEYQHSVQKLAELETEKAGRSGDSERLYAEYVDKRRRREEEEEKLSEMEARLKRVNADKKQATNRRKELLGVEKEREMLVRDAEERLKQEEDKERENRETVRKLQADIQRRETEGKDVEREYEEKRREEEEKKTEVRRGRARLEDLNAKQGRSAQFSTKRERDAFLQQQRRETERGVREEEKKAEELEREAKDTDDKQRRLEAESNKRSAEMEQLKQQMDTTKQTIDQLSTQRDTLMAQKRELQRDEQSDDDDTAARERREKEYAACMDSDVYRAIQSVNRYCDQHADVKAGVLGCVVDLFTVAPDFYRAVEVSAGAALFHIVVRDDAIASTLIAHLNSTRGGRVTFIPLNRITAPDSTPPKTPDAIPLLDKLRYDASLRPLFVQLFGRVLVCRDLHVAAQLSSAYDYTTLTLGGDKIDRKGVITGGYVDVTRSRLVVYREWKEGKDRADERKEKRRKAAEELAKREADLNRVMSDQHKATEELKRLRRRYDSMQLDAKHFTATMQGLRDTSSRLRDALKRLEESVAEGRARLAALDVEMRSAFSTDLSVEEQRELSTLTRQVKEDESALAELTKQRVELEIAKQRGETRVRQVLQRRLDELMAELEGTTMDELRDDVQRGRRELNELTKEREEVDRIIRRLDDEVDGLLKDSKRLQSDIEKHKVEENKAKAAYNELLNGMETLLGQRTKYQHKKDECQRKIRELGPLNLAGADREKHKTVKVLLRELEELNRQLLAFQHVNKKALDQYIALTEQRDDLLDRKKELDSSRVAILQLIDHLDQKKDEAIERTFKQIAQHFSAVFSELVDGGKGTLVIQTRRVEDETEEEARERREREREEEEIRRARSRGAAGRAGGRRGRSSKAGEAEEEEEKKESAPPVAAASIPPLTSLSYTGIGIKVSFTGTAAATHQLSGGQESVVALSLIFAIQRCDPSPFYLFDEIDSALDPVHRAAVAAMIEKQKVGEADGGQPGVGAQFLTTTFSSEMIEVADQCYGVVFQNKVSKVRLIDKDEALELVRMEEREAREQGRDGGREDEEMKG